MMARWRIVEGGRRAVWCDEKEMAVRRLATAQLCLQLEAFHCEFPGVVIRAPAPAEPFRRRVVFHAGGADWIALPAWWRASVLLANARAYFRGPVLDDRGEPVLAMTPHGPEPFKPDRA